MPANKKKSKKNDNKTNPPAKRKRKSKKDDAIQVKIREGIDKQVEEITHYLFNMLKNKEGVVNLESLKRTINSLNLWDDINEDIIEILISFFTSEDKLAKNQVLDIFYKCKIDVKGFLV